MKLYRKQLNNVDELKRECIRLNYKKKHAGPLDLFGNSPSAEGGKKKVGDDTGQSSGIMSTALSLMGGGSALQTVLSIAGPVLGRMGKSKTPKKILGNIAKDVLVSYITGKGIQVIFKIVSRQLKKRKEARRFEKAIRVPVRSK